jgi:hypothetical protein
MNDPTLIDALSRASSLELFRLSVLIDRLLADPRRIVAIRSLLHVGQTVRFCDPQRGEFRTGRVVALGDRQITVQEDGSRSAWKLPYAAIELPGASEPIEEATSRPRAPEAARPQRQDFRRGDRVTFDDRYLQAHVGTIVRINQRTASVECDGRSWRVPFALLRHVVDV